MASGPENAVRNYLAALKDPNSLRDENAIEAVRKELAGADDPIERLRLQDQLSKLESPSLESYEDEFVVHAKAWADANSISVNAFLAEGVDPSVLQRAGFDVRARARGRGRRRGRPRTAPVAATPRKRVTSDEVRAAIPRTAFTAKMLQERSGASPAVVRKVINEALESGLVVEQGRDPDHTGPGRAPMLYKRA